MSTRGPVEPQPGPSKGPISSDHLFMNYSSRKTTVYPLLLVITQSRPMSTDIQSDFSSVVHLTLPHELRGRSDRECQDLRSQTWCPETCQDCGSADSVSPRPARICGSG
ncbi:hypothetical protein Prudu_000454 [Prunus dulcis]|uniref:Uncharacterized protein n=1 Tax=Prunus dulcis TaxID=3755 RepID=A0A4Y1QL93_PRUDU|nr:hypothetical protein Prudu_000454 [Prunus dulcis]